MQTLPLRNLLKEDFFYLQFAEKSIFPGSAERMGVGCGIRSAPSLASQKCKMLIVGENIFLSNCARGKRKDNNHAFDSPTSFAPQ